jgi:hypothetical protein
MWLRASGLVVCLGSNVRSCLIGEAGQGTSVQVLAGALSVPGCRWDSQQEGAHFACWRGQRADWHVLNKLALVFFSLWLQVGQPAGACQHCADWQVHCAE